SFISKLNANAPETFIVGLVGSRVVTALRNSHTHTPAEQMVNKRGCICLRAWKQMRCCRPVVVFIECECADFRSYFNASGDSIRQGTAVYRLGRCLMGVLDTATCNAIFIRRIQHGNVQLNGP